MMKALTAALVAATAVTMPLSAASAADDVVIVYDASGSMWGQIDGVTKIEIARGVMADLVNGWPDDINLGLVAYGHRSEGDCRDIETLIEPKRLDRAGFIKTVNGIRPKGKTPISAAVQHAADLLSYRDTPATVVLISDGLETCQADPCALAEQLARQGVKFTTHVVGFDLEDKAHASLACIAENTGGVFVPAQNAAELKDALAHVQSVMDLQPMAQEIAEPTPEPEPAPQVEAEIELEAPATVTTGANFAVSWSEIVHPQDRITIVPAGADEGSNGSYVDTGTRTSANLVAPGKPGLYEVRYVLKEGRRTLGSTPFEVVEGQISVTAPQQVATGARFTAGWSETINPQDRITIVPAGADEGSHGPYVDAGARNAADVVAPGNPGLYEVRYVLKEGRRTLGSASFEVIETAVTINGPDTVRAGSMMRVSWSQAINPQDRIAIVPAGADEGSSGDYTDAGSKVSGDFKAPKETGLYELRYILKEGRRTLASHRFEVVAEDAPLDDGAGLKAPAQAGVGETITVSWSAETGSADQRVAIARADQADFSWIAAHKAGTEKTLELQVPAEAGTYEVRFLDVSGRKVLGRSIVEVK